MDRFLWRALGGRDSLLDHMFRLRTCNSITTSKNVFRISDHILSSYAFHRIYRQGTTSRAFSVFVFSKQPE